MKCECMSNCIHQGVQCEDYALRLRAYGLDTVDSSTKGILHREVCGTQLLIDARRYAEKQNDMQNIAYRR